MPQNTRDRPSSGEKWPTRVGDYVKSPGAVGEHQVEEQYRSISDTWDTCQCVPTKRQADGQDSPRAGTARAGRTGIAYI